jgi:nucleotide-binding universal stress UspA family protein
MYDEILLPSDGSPAADAALDHALDIAATSDARLHVLYVVDQSAIDGLVSESELVAVALENEGTETVEAIEKAAADRDLDVVTNVVTGRPARTILDYVADNGIDLVVMGTHGRRGLDRYLLGSVTERVVRGSDVSVLVVRQADAAADSDESDESGV